MDNTISIAYKERIISAVNYINEIKYKRDAIESVEFIPPKLGQNGYGSFRVRYKYFMIDECAS